MHRWEDCLKYRSCARNTCNDSPVRHYDSAVTLPPEGLGVSFAPPGLFHFRGIAPMMHAPMRSVPTRRCLLVAATCAASSLACCSGVRPGGAGTTPGGIVQLGPGLEVDRSAGEVRIDAAVACDRGWLEQAVCRVGTREHESLLAVDVAPSRIHAALLLLGLRPGSPGGWRPTPSPDAAGVRTPPSGDRVDVLVRVGGRETPLASWIHDPVGGRDFPPDPWVFAGSRLRPAGADRGEAYVADLTGTVVGIVTFGDEPIAFRDVLSDRADVDAPQWQARSDAMPASGTRALLVVRRSTAGDRP